ncbi:JAB domain-containing protein [Azospirillum baldaniorum]|uniref:JAB domain-containing protein n=1 Tax=Azospirillum baldaniorum TaxID=1064539 RepID=UPI00157A268F|nr:JAB domain-containing protein [Azospirillum baldaniorum]
MRSAAKPSPRARNGKRTVPGLRPYPATIGLTVDRSLEVIPDEALLGCLLTLADPEVDGDVLALRLLAAHGSLEEAVAAASVGNLPGGVASDGHAVVRFQAVVELAARLVRPSLERHPVFVAHDSLVAYSRLRAACSTVQALRLLFLDDRRHLIADEIHQTGTFGDVAIYVREIMGRALQMEARGLVIVHSGPDDDPPNPAGARTSCADIQQAGKFLGVELVEYLLVGRRSYCTLIQEPADARVGRRSSPVAGDSGPSPDRKR